MFPLGPKETECANTIHIQGSEAARLSLDGTYSIMYENTEPVLRRDQAVWKHETKEHYLFVASHGNLHISEKKDFDADNTDAKAWTPFKNESPCPYSYDYIWRTYNSSWNEVTKSELRIDPVGKRF